MGYFTILYLIKELAFCLGIGWARGGQRWNSKELWAAGKEGRGGGLGGQTEGRARVHGLRR